MNCPNCNHHITDRAVLKESAKINQKKGVKNRDYTSDEARKQASRAVKIRWANWRKQQKKTK